MLNYIFFFNFIPGDSPNSRRVLFDYPASPYLYGNYHHPSPSEDLLLWFGSTSAGEFILIKTRRISKQFKNRNKSTL